MMNLVNGILRLYGLNGMSHESFDWDIRQANLNFSRYFLHKVKESNFDFDFDTNKYKNQDSSMVSKRKSEDNILKPAKFEHNRADNNINHVGIDFNHRLLF